MKALKSTIFLTLFALLGLVAKPQETITIANGTITSSYIPIYGLYLDEQQRSQFIYPSTLLTDLPAEVFLSEMKFYLSSPPSVAWAGVVDVLISNTTQNDLNTSWATDELTTVYSSSLSIVNNEITILFSDPFFYTGNNLLVSFIERVASNYSSASFLGVTHTGGSRNAYGTTYLTSTGTVRNFLPKVKLTYSIPITPFVITKLATDITSNSGVLNGEYYNIETPSEYGFKYRIGAREWSYVTCSTNPMTFLVNDIGLLEPVEYYAFAAIDTDTIWGSSMTFLPTLEPVNNIYTEEELIRVRQYINLGYLCAGLTFNLMNDISLTQDWVPITAFSGTFNGNYNKIDNLNFTISSGSNVGFIGILNTTGIVKNLGIESGNIFITGSSSENGSPLIGKNYGLIENCYNKANLTYSGTRFRFGGIAGVNDKSGTLGGKIRNCYNSGNITLTNETAMNVGGITGSEDSGVAGFIENCYNTGTISGKKLIAGCAGNVSTGSIVRNCYNIGSILNYQGGTGTPDMWGNVIYKQILNITTTNCYFLSTNNNADNWNAKGRTVDQFQNELFPDTLTAGQVQVQFNNVDMNIWIQDNIIQANNGYPILYWQYENTTNPFAYTYNASNIDAFSADVSGRYVNITDATEVGFRYKIEGALNWEEEALTEVTQTFNTNLSGLLPSTTYLFKSYVKYGVSNEVEGVEKRFTTLATCLPPTINPLIALDGGSSLSVSWEENNTATEWIVAYKKTNDTDFIEKTNIITNPYLLSGLDAITNYDVKVKSKCSDSDLSVYSGVKTISTSCGYLNLPFYEGFSTESLPRCWSNMKIASGSGTGNTSGLFIFPNSGNNPTCSPKSGTNMARFNSYDYQNGTKGILVTPLLNGLVEFAEVDFWMYRDNGATTNREQINVYVNSTPDTINATLLLTINRKMTLEPVEPTAGWYNYSAHIPQGSFSYVIFEGVSGRGYNMFIDEINIFTATTCFRPTNLVLNHVAYNYANLSWSAGGSENNWQIDYKKTTDSEWSHCFPEDTTYNLLGLLPDAEYNVRIRAICGVGDTSHWASNVLSFRTPCTPENIPYLEVFANRTTLPSCGIYFNGGNLNACKVQQDATFNGGMNGANKVLEMGSQSTSIKPIYVTAPINARLDTIRLSFYANKTYPQELQIGYITDNSSPQTSFVQLTTTTSAATGGYKKFIFDLDNPAYNIPEGIDRIAIKLLTTANWQLAYIDSILVAYVPKKYNIIATSSSNGSISPNGVVSVDEGEDKAFSITPNIGYEINQVLVDGINNNDAVSEASHIFENVMAAHSIEVIFSPINYNIIYNNVNGATNNSPISYNIETPTIILSTLNRDGYRFDGWYNNPEFTGSPITEIQIGSTGNKEFWAKWTIITYTITYYNVNSATNDNPATYTIESETIELNPLTKPGFIFNGWYDNVDFTGSSITEIISGSIGNKEFWAKWTAISYSITYNNLNGATNTNPNSYTIITNTFTLNAAIKAGYTFDGWYDNPDFTGSPITQIILGSMGDKEFWAKWSITTFSILYNNANGATNTNPTAYTIESETIELIPLTKEGYIFEGWYDNELFSGFSTTEIISGSVGNKEFWAKWSTISYSITYNNTNGAANTNPTNYTTETPNITLLPLTRNGYTFIGWFDNSEFTGNPTVTIAVGSTGNKVFWAKWEIQSYTITYNNVNDATNNNPDIYTIETLPIIFTALNKTGYIFEGWYNNDVFAGEPISGILSGSTGNKEFWAKWTVETYTIRFNANGGTGIMTNQIFTYGIARNLNTNTFQNGSLYFDGWSTSETGDVEYNDRDLYLATEDAILYAKWTDIQPIFYTITASAGINGVINPNGVINVRENSDKTFNFSANDGYKISKVLIDGVNNPDAVSNGTYTFYNVTFNHEIQVVIVLDVSVDQNTFNNVNVYSNSNNVYIINETNINIESVEILDMTGSIIYRDDMKYSNKIINLNVSNGIYIVRLISDKYQIMNTKVNIIN